MDWWMIATGVITILGAVTTFKWRGAKNLLKETAEALMVTAEAIDDDTITMDEAKAMASEWGDVIAAARDMAGK